MKHLSPILRIMLRVERQPSGCWEFNAHRDEWGYGRIQVGRQSRRAHRVMYEHEYGAIGTGLFICHRCDNPACVNPKHLFAGTPLDNVHDAIAKGRHRSRDAGCLNREKATEIHLLLRAGFTQEDIAGRYGVARSTIAHVATGRTWKEANGVAAHP